MFRIALRDTREHWVRFAMSILAVLLFFMNIMVIKNPEMPPALRVALPIINTAAATLAVLLLMGMLG